MSLTHPIQVHASEKKQLQRLLMYTWKQPEDPCSQLSYASPADRKLSGNFGSAHGQLYPRNGRASSEVAKLLLELRIQ
eukprot:1089771-Amphidinium_carterae.1